MEYECLKDIQVSEYEYPGEANAFALLKKIPLLNQVTGAFLKYTDQMGWLSEVQGDCFRITEKTAPEVYRIYKKALKRLDMEEEYPFYAKSEYEYNAYTAGGNAPYVVIHSSMLKNLTEEELLFVLGHELGHIKSGHLIYCTMARYINLLLSQIPMPGVDVVAAGIQFALIHWARMHEYTADRAGVLAAGSIEAGQHGLGCLLGMDTKIPGICFTIEDMLAQNASFEESNEDIWGKIVSASLIMQSTHPWTVSRIQELEKWREEGGYGELMGKFC